MKKIGIIGLGMLCNAVALHLVDSGYEVTAYNRTKEKSTELKEKGATIVESPKKVAENSELVIIIVKDADAVKQVSFENNGIVNGNHEKLIVADMSTVDPSESKNISKQFIDSGIMKLDIPVMGGPNVAITGDLVLMASGNKESFDYVFYIAGVDIHFNDRLGKLKITDEGVKKRDELVTENFFSKGVPLCGVLGGGYNKDFNKLIELHASLHQSCAKLL